MKPSKLLWHLQTNHPALKDESLTILTNGLSLSRKLAREIAVCSKTAIKTTGEQTWMKTCWVNPAGGSVLACALMQQQQLTFDQ